AAESVSQNQKVGAGGTVAIACQPPFDFSKSLAVADPHETVMMSRSCGCLRLLAVFSACERWFFWPVHLPPGWPKKSLRLASKSGGAMKRKLATISAQKRQNFTPHFGRLNIRIPLSIAFQFSRFLLRRVVKLRDGFLGGSV
ncbi:MAG TPA: hypothetical protein PK225_12765, partial [Azonexus sp.]|nr:hypothetical protein [Azonexus sp.]